MSAKLSKIGPIAVVAVILGSLCWPYFDDPTPAAKSKSSAKSAAPLASLLNPRPAGDVRADLFEIPKIVGPAVAKKPATSTSAGQAAAAKKTASARSDDLKSFVLTGTYVAGGRRIAVINGSLYAEGETITSAGPKAKSAPVVCTVLRVEIDKVVLSFQGQTKELRYADAPVAPEPKTRSGGATSTVGMSADRAAGNADMH
jgi:hypothetical protein